MPGPLQGRLSPNRLPIDSESIAEVLFVLLVFFMLLGPAGGLFLSASATISGIFAKGAGQVESTRNLAEQLLVASDRIKALEKKVADDEIELTKLRQEAKDQDKLRGLLGLKQSIARRTIAANVVSHNPDNWYQLVTLDKGEADNVRVGSAVITNQGVVGQVVKVEQSASIVRLVTDPDEKFGVLIGRSNTPGVIVGRNKQLPVIRFVPVGSAVDVGDKITCLGNGGIFPEGHPVGIVAMVSRGSDGLTTTIDVEPSQNIFDLTHVLIVPPINQ